MENFENLKNGDLIISPIDCEVTEFKKSEYDDEYYLCSKNCMFPLFQFNPKDFVKYLGNMKAGEVDKNYFKKG